MFLTPEQLAELTGKRRPSAQIRWLEQNDWQHTVGIDGYPSVLVAECERNLVGPTTPAVETARIYVIGAVGRRRPVKIGTTIDVRRRLASLQSGSPLKLELRRCYEVPLDDSYRIENHCHIHFKAARSHGEWFEITASEVEAWLRSALPNLVRRYTA